MQWPDDVGQAPSILAEVREGVGIVTLNRPSRLNAWTPLMGTLYFDTLDRLAHDTDVRAILVTGNGKSFCAGADMSGLSAVAVDGGMTDRRDPRGYWHPLRIGKPIISAIRGYCLGVGLQQALCCDVRFAATDVNMSTSYVRRGINGELGITWLLPRIVGASRALDLMLSGRHVFGDEAVQLGLVNRLCAADELFATAFDYCRMLVQESSPWAMRTIKQQVYFDLMTALPPAFRQAEQLLGTAMSGPDMAEFIAARKDKRQVHFPPLSPDLASLDPWPGE
jgi:enoyl-CoA hydratase/carnithine racemase